MNNNRISPIVAGAAIFGIIGALSFAYFHIFGGAALVIAATVMIAGILRSKKERGSRLTPQASAE